MNSPNNSDTPRTDAEAKDDFMVNWSDDGKMVLGVYVRDDFARTLERELNAAKDSLNESNWMLGKCSCGGNIVHEIDEPFAECDKCHIFGEATEIPYPQQVKQLRADLKMCAEALQLAAKHSQELQERLNLLKAKYHEQ